MTTITKQLKTVDVAGPAAQAGPGKANPRDLGQAVAQATQGEGIGNGAGVVRPFDAADFYHPDLAERPTETQARDFLLKTGQDIMRRYAATTPAEILAQAPRIADFAREYGALTVKQFEAVALDAVIANRYGQLEILIQRVADKTLSHFSPTGYVNTAGNERRSIIQHMGYVSGELHARLGLAPKDTLPVLNNYFTRMVAGDFGEAQAAKLVEDLAKLKGANSAAVKTFAANDGWMFMAGSGWGARDIALNMPGVYATEAAREFATQLTRGDSDSAEKLLKQLAALSSNPEEFSKLLELKEKKGNQLAILAEFGARAGHAPAWAPSKRADAVVLAHQGKGEKALKAYNPSQISAQGFDGAKTLADYNQLTPLDRLKAAMQVFNPAQQYA